MDILNGADEMEHWQAQAQASCQQAEFYHATLRLEEDKWAGAVAQFYPSGDGSMAVRDPCGGCLLHWCMLLGSGPEGQRNERHRALARYIVDTCPTTLLDLQFDRSSPHCVHYDAATRTWTPNEKTTILPYSQCWYDGQTALHIAVAKGDVFMVDMLIAKKVSPRKRAFGSFFSPGNNGACYFGEYPLSFAAACGLNDIVRKLLGAYPKAIQLYDSFGNTAYHLAIIHRRWETYKVLVEESGSSYQEVALRHGAMGFTPLTMAAFHAPGGDDAEGDGSGGGDDGVVDCSDGFGDDTGDNESMFRRVLDSTRDTSWEYATVVMNSCPLEQIDTLMLRHIGGSTSPVPGVPSQSRRGSTAAPAPSTTSKVSPAPAAPIPVPQAWSPLAGPADEAPPPASGDAAGGMSEMSEVNADAGSGSGNGRGAAPRGPRDSSNKPPNGEGGGSSSSSSNSSSSSSSSSSESDSDDEVDRGADSVAVDVNAIADAFALSVVENTRYHSVLATMLNYSLYHLADDEIIESLLLWKWHVIRYAYYFCIVYQLVYLAALTFFTITIHPKYYGRLQGERNLLYALVLILSIVGLCPFLYDIFAGYNFRKATITLRAEAVARKGRPKLLNHNKPAWEEYIGRETQAVPRLAQRSWLARLGDAFPLSGFDYCSLISFILLMAFYGLEYNSQYDLVFPSKPDAPANATLSEAVANITLSVANATAGDPKPDVQTPTFSVILGLACMFSWMSTLTFAPVHPRVGNVVTMMIRTIASDVVPFLIVFVVLLGASSVAIYSCMHDGYTLAMVVDILKDAVIPTAEVELWLRNGGPGDSGPDGGEGADRRVWVIITYVLVLTFTIVWALLMLNLFIAALTSTYENVKTKAHQEWKLQFGRDVMLLERRMYLLSYFGSRLRCNHGTEDQHVLLSISKHGPKKPVQEAPATAAPGGGKTSASSQRPSDTDLVSILAAQNLEQINSKRKRT